MAACALVLAACGDDVTEVTEIRQEGMAVLEKGEKLSKQACDTANVGEMLFVMDSVEAFICDGESWRTLKGADGKDGSDGKDGTDGKDGVDGKDGKDMTSFPGAIGSFLKSASGWSDCGSACEKGMDAFGFSVLPAGRSCDVVFNGVGEYAYIWSAKGYSEDGAYSIMLDFDNENAYLFHNLKRCGSSVRCLKD